MKKLISNIAIIIALVVSSVSYSNAQGTLNVKETKNEPLGSQPLHTIQLTNESNNTFKQKNTDNTEIILEKLYDYDYFLNTGAVVFRMDSIISITTLGIITTLKLHMYEVNDTTSIADLTIIIQTTAPTVPSTASVKDVEVSNFSVYPNPVVDVLNIKFDAYEEVDVVVMDMSGRIVYNEPTSTMTTVNMSDQPSGMYLVKIGNQTQRVIKQ